jgi:hypothetical protein
MDDDVANLRRGAMFLDVTHSDAKWKELALAWKHAAPKLRARRHADIRRQNNAEAIKSLDSLFRQVIARHVPSRTSGLVKMYEVLKRQPNG